MATVNFTTQEFTSRLDQVFDLADNGEKVIIRRGRRRAYRLIPFTEESSGITPELQAKIRHFYDLHFLLQDDECRTYLNSTDFKQDFQTLFDHDKQTFDKPQGWQDRDITDSPLVTNLQGLWAKLQETYLRELPDLAYQQIPDVLSIKTSMQEMISKLVNQ